METGVPRLTGATVLTVPGVVRPTGVAGTAGADTGVVGAAGSATVAGAAWAATALKLVRAAAAKPTLAARVMVFRERLNDIVFPLLGGFGVVSSLMTRAFPEGRGSMRAGGGGPVHRPRRMTSASTGPEPSGARRVSGFFATLAERVALGCGTRPGPWLRCPSPQGR